MAGRVPLLRGIALIGLSGAGKSTVAPPLAARVGGAWIDLDRLVEETSGSAVATLIESRGEAAFRDLECEALRRALEGAGAGGGGTEGLQVVACGAGILNRAENRALLREAAFVAWLRVDPETAAARLGEGAERVRPMLRGAGLIDRLRALDVERRAHYAAAADVTVETDRRSALEVAALVAEAWLKRRAEWERSES
jgi:shikimate kinase